MKIAVTYENGEVFQHFGRTEQFKVYETDGSRIVSSQVVGCGGAAHESLGGVLKKIGAEVLICGGMGMGARNMMDSIGVKVCTGMSGDADSAVEAYLAGKAGNPEAGVHACSGH